MTPSKRIAFRALPNQSRLFLDYVELSPEALQFYGAQPTLASLVEAPGRVLQAHEFPREQLSAILRRQNEVFGPDESVFDHISQLRDPGCIAVVTGQQVGLFTGPLYTVYKALTTIRLAELLRVRGIPAVPVFWMDAEDHDLAEITHLTVVGEDAEVRTFDFLAPLLDGAEVHARPAASIALPPSVHAVVEQYVSALPAGEHRDRVVSDIRACYPPGVDFATAFARLLARVFHGRGLVLFNPYDPAAKELLSPLFREAVRQNAAIRQQVADRTRLLTQHGYHGQVNVLENSTVLFLEHEGERRALTVQDGRFQLKGADASFPAADLMLMAESEPQRFSPNVLLRPIAQDFLFPTAAYVAGPSETAYFAQIEAIYRLLRRPMPVIWPRDSFTLLDPEVSARMNSYGLGLEDCLRGRDHLTERILQGANQASALSTLNGLRTSLEHEMEALRPAVAAADASLGPALDTARRKILHQIETLETKLVHFESRRNSQFAGIADFLLAHCYPNRSLQERQLGIHQFAARFGPDLLDVLYSLCGLDNFAHAVVPLAAGRADSR